jgi:hypothetical protein
MQLRGIIAVYSKNYDKKHKSLCGFNAEFLNVKTGGTYCYHCALKG